MNNFKVFEETVLPLIDHTAELHVYYVTGEYVFERCDWNYDIINCHDCNHEYWFRCHDIYELLYKVCKQYSEVYHSIRRMFDKFNCEFDKDPKEVMRLIIDNYLDKDRSSKEGCWGNQIFQWQYSNDYDEEYCL